MKNQIFTVLMMLGSGIVGVNAQIIYTDVNPDVTIGMDQMYLLDVDNDANNDYIIEQVDSVISGNSLEGVQLRSIGTVNEAVYETSTLTFLSSIPANDVINGTQLWTVPSPSLPAGGVIMVGSNPFPAGDWADGLDHYAGLRFTTGPNQYYGWVRFSVTTDGLSFTIKDYAYHSTPDQALLAGATVDAVNENAEGAFFMTQSNGFITLKNSRSLNNTIKIYSVSGQLMKEITMTENTITLDLNVLPFGIYLISCNGENGEALFKVNNLK